MRKSIPVLLSTLLVTSALAFPVQAVAVSKEEKLKRASTKNEVKEILKDRDVALVDPKQVNINAILDELGIGLKFALEDESDQLEALAIMADDEQYVPIYLYGKKNGKETSEKSYEENIKKAIDKYKEKKKKEREKTEGNASTLAVGSNYSMQGEALKITSSLDGTPFWYTEYRVYEGSGSNSNLDYYYLRADHDYDGDDLPYSIEDLYGFKAQWWKDWSDMDLLDPDRESDSNSDGVTISIPGGISWGALFNPELDIETDIEIDDDLAVWEVESFVLENFPISDDKQDFDFTHGVYIESDEDNDGFRMNVWYEGWTDIGVDFDDNNNTWYSRYDVIFEDSNDDIDTD